MRRFVGDPARNRIDLGGRRMQLSQLFNWYADDLGGPEQVDDYVNRYVDGVDVRGFAIDFLDYSWRLNLAGP